MMKSAVVNSVECFHIAVGGDPEEVAKIWRGLVSSLTFEPSSNGTVQWLAISGPEEVQGALKALLKSKVDAKGPYVHVSDGQAELFVKKVTGLFPGINFRNLNETTVLVHSPKKGKIDPLLRAMRNVSAVKS